MIETVVFEVIARERNCTAGDISLDMRLEDLGIDSLKAITILYEIEEQLNIEIPNELVESVRTVGDIVTGIDKLKNHGESGWQGAS